MLSADSCPVRRCQVDAGVTGPWYLDGRPILSICKRDDKTKGSRLEVQGRRCACVLRKG